MLALWMLAQAVHLHSAWPGRPGGPPPPPEYNAAIGDPIGDNVPPEHWRCTMDKPSQMRPFDLAIDNKAMTRKFDAGFDEGFATLSNSTLGAISSRVVNDVEDGKPGIGAFTIALNKVTGGFMFSAAFAGNHNGPPVEGNCKRKDQPSVR